MRHSSENAAAQPNRLLQEDQQRRINAAEKEQKRLEDADHAACLKHVEEALKVNTIRYIVDVMRDLGREFNAGHVKCLRSTVAGPHSTGAMAGYMWGNTSSAKKGEIVLHEDQAKTQADVERNLRHELIHAFDDVRGHIEPTNCYHHACSEVRAARLSGDCFLGEEVKRGNLDFMFSGRTCVSRRAAMAVENNPLCRGFGARAVERVFLQCYSDYEPFVAPIYGMGDFKGRAPPDYH